MSKENTFRTLKGQDPIQRFRCRVLNWHRWTTWSVDDARRQQFMDPLMECHCVDCGIIRIEKPYSKTYGNK